MKLRSVLIWLVALVTLGSGLVNLLSVIGPSLPERMIILRGIFPLEFLHFTRFLTLLIGFSLVISSLNIYKRKRRAFQSVLLLSGFSILFNMIKGLDYEEASLSFFLLIILYLARKSFTVKSSIPDYRWGFIRFTIAGALGFGYGIAGFWLLDEKEFGINFTIGDAIHRAFLFLTLAGDPQVVPHTRYAHWFLDSLYLITATTIIYSLFALFRPVIYQYATIPREREWASNLVTKFGRSALDYFKLWPDKSFFFSQSRNCFLAYRVGGNFAVVLADPVGPEEEIGEVIQSFTKFCHENDWGVGFHQTLPDFLPVYTRSGFKKLKIGDDAIVDLTKFTLEGKIGKEFRNTTTRLEKLGIHIRSFDPPISDEIVNQIKVISDEWLQTPGRRERSFTLGMFETNYVRTTSLLTAVDKDERILAFMNIIPSYCKGEATIDLMRRRTEAPNGIMDYLFAKLFFRCREQGYHRFNLGMAPMSGFQEREETSVEEKAIHFFFQRLNFIFSFTGLKQYKAKFANYWEPRYVIYRNIFDLPKFASALGKVSELKDE